MFLNETGNVDTVDADSVIYSFFLKVLRLKQQFLPKLRKALCEINTDKYTRTLLSHNFINNVCHCYMLQNLKDHLHKYCCSECI